METVTIMTYEAGREKRENERKMRMTLSPVI